MEIQWGQPLVLTSAHTGETERFGTIEKVRHWLHRRWPVTDTARDRALATVNAAMDCMSPVEDARRAFVIAALSAGFVPSAA